MGLNLSRDKLCVLQMANQDGYAFLVQFLDGNYNAPNLKKLLLDESKQKIFHFARFDLTAIRKYLDIELQNIFCTKISSFLVRTYTDNHGLRDICRELLDVHISKQEQSSDWGAKQLSKNQINYAAGDVIFLHQLRDILTRMLHRENRYQLAIKLFNFLQVRVELDLLGWKDIDIYSHSIK